jgi:DNA-binding NtrC family response regulator
MSDDIQYVGRILVIDDEPVIMDVLDGVLGTEGYDLDFAADAATGREKLGSAENWDLILLDMMLPDADGLEVLSWIRESQPDVAVVMITAYGTVENAVAAMQAGAFHYITKPFQNEEVRLLVKKAIQHTHLRKENTDLKRVLGTRFKFEKIIGKSRSMQEVYRFIEQVAGSRSTLLIQGESGTGKELVAHAIHKRGPRATRPFVVVNSSSIPTELLEDNLFGHVRGAFTGANTAKKGLFEVADGGTIVFDEISCVNLEVQAKLLRVIQEKEFLPLGAIDSRKVDVRILAATNDKLSDMVQAGSFREDLFYRLNVISVTLPPLRERAGDLPLLVGHFLARFNEENDKNVERIAPEMLQRLHSYHWPGNVRELENSIERGIVLARGPELTLDLLPDEIRKQVGAPQAVDLGGGIDLHEILAQYERHLIRAALKRSSGVQKRAAVLLGLKPTTLNEKIKRLGLTE